MEIPSYLLFMEKDYCTYDQNVLDTPDVSISVDCSDIERFVMRKKKFLTGKCSICLDHHRTNNYFAEMNYIDEFAGATGEIVYDRSSYRHRAFSRSLCSILLRP